MPRREFPKAVKVAVIKRSTRGMVTYCEGCGALAKSWRIDHKRADGLLGEPTIENAWLLGPCCFVEKDAADTRAIARAKRIEARHIGAREAKGAIKSRGFERRERVHEGREPVAGASEIARRFGQ